MSTYDLTSSVPSASSLKTGDILNIPYSGSAITFTLPKGTYKLECWGAYGEYSSASSSSSHTYGYGGYSTGTLTLSSSKTMHCYVGGIGPGSTYSNSYYYGGWNGGGSKAYSSSYRDNGCGGGATDFCFTLGSISLDSYYRYVRTSASYNSRILVAGGGGGGRTNNVECQGNYCPAVATSPTYAGKMNGVGTVASGSVTGAFGYGGSNTNTSDDRAAGGGGWYGGNSAGDSYGGGGSGFAWCSTYASYVPSAYSVSSSYYLTDVSIAVGSSSTNVNPAGVTSNGYARVTCTSVDSLTPPTSVSLSSRTNTSITLSWSGASGQSGYYIYKDFTSEECLVTATTSTSFTFSNLAPGVSHTFYIYSYDSSGTISTSYISTTQSTTSVSNPTVTVTSSSPYKVNVSWTAVSSATKYKLYRNGSLIETTTSTSYTDTSVSPATSYTYKVVTVQNVSVGLPNMMVYPNFDSQTGWSSGSYSTDYKRSGSYSYKLTATTSNVEVFAYPANTMYQTSGHIYYASLYSYQSSLTSGASVQWYWPIAEPSMGSSALSTTGSWSLHSTRIVRSSWTSGHQSMRIDFNNNYVAGTLYIDDTSLVDLTYAFGSGNEPSVTEIDSNFTYGSSTAYIAHDFESSGASATVTTEAFSFDLALTAEIQNGILNLTWTTDDNIEYYEIYRGSTLLDTITDVQPLFEFEFSNDSLVDDLLAMSNIFDGTYLTEIPSQSTSYTYTVKAYVSDSVADSESVTITYWTTVDFTSVTLTPNPTTVGHSVLISTGVENNEDSTITYTR